ncbi:MAG: TIM44-like domain-containing protein, partial [Epibacterium sp.]|nr:TIM44-like domain-containing protein [Epibacterium sp.]NQX75661.1 TIM44-like domain-containing protein [Epibacterium sp.]
ETNLVGAKYDPATGLAEISMQFVGELTSAVRNRDGEIVEGDPKKVKRQKDTWTFARKMAADDPNWQLVATDV